MNDVKSAVKLLVGHWYGNREAVSELAIDAEIVKVDDFAEIAKFGVMMTPALVVDGQVKFVGKVPGKEELKKMLM